MAISPTDIQILFTNYDIITYFLNLAFCSEHFISIKHWILATFNINEKNSILTAFKEMDYNKYYVVGYWFLLEQIKKIIEKKWCIFYADRMT